MKEDLSLDFFQMRMMSHPIYTYFKGNGKYPQAKWWLTPKPNLEYSEGFTVQEHRIIEDIIEQKYLQMLTKWKQHFKI